MSSRARAHTHTRLIHVYTHLYKHAVIYMFAHMNTFICMIKGVVIRSPPASVHACTTVIRGGYKPRLRPLWSLPRCGRRFWCALLCVCRGGGAGWVDGWLFVCARVRDTHTHTHTHTHRHTHTHTHIQDAAACTMCVWRSPTQRPGR